jgi:Uma2 family endonuclease
MATTTVPGGWTYRRYLELDDDQRYEILDGELLMTPAPGTQHQRIALKLSRRFADFVEERGLGEVFPAPTDVVLDDDQVVQPDVLFVRKDRLHIVQPRAIHGAPDLVVEILSPASLRTDRHRKASLYERAGVTEYWIVDPANRALEVHLLGESGYELFSFAAETGAVGSRVLDGLAIAVAEVMGKHGAA